MQGAAACDLLSLDSPWPFLKNHPDTSTITNEVALLKDEILPILKIKTKKESSEKIGKRTPEKSLLDQGRLAQGRMR